MKRFLLILAACIVCASSAERPNVLLICVDDLKPALGCYGDPIATTPHLDRLAKRGLRFERAYCNQAVCAPSRHALMLGLRPQTLGIYDLSTRFRSVVPDAVTWPQHFKANGYRAESMGKIYHTGHGNVNDTASWSVPPWKPSGIKMNSYRDPASAPDKSSEARGSAYEAPDVSDEGYFDGALANLAVERLSALQELGKPWFLAVGFYRPHLPFCAPKRYWDLYQRSAFSVPPRVLPEGAPTYAPNTSHELRKYKDIPKDGALDDDLSRALIHGYYASISFVDAQVGKILAALDAGGQAGNTIIVLWGDHGFHLGDHGMWCKHTNYEQAVRIPLIISGPGITPGSSTSALIESVDLYPSISELAGLPAPGTLDGVSQAGVLRGAAGTRDHVIHVYPRDEGLGRAIRTARWRLVEWKMPGAAPETAQLELYDYQDDQLETKNLAVSEPEVVAELRELLATHPEAKPQAFSEAK